jgi:flagellar basal-body rod protein FlgG
MEEEENMPVGITEAIKACLKEEMRMDIITNNLANASVCGFKKYRISFRKVLEGAEGAKGGSSSRGQKAPETSVRTEVDFSQGDLRQTGNPLDLAIHGKGFFKVQTEDGVQYTRKGNFLVDSQGFLVTQEGQKVLSQGGPIQVPRGEISVDPGGTLAVNGDALGIIDLVDFENPEALLPMGKAMFSNPNGEPEKAPDLQTSLQQGYIEGANVEVAEEMVNMIHSLRAFESYQKVIQVLDELNNRVINEVSQLR